MRLLRQRLVAVARITKRRLELRASICSRARSRPAQRVQGGSVRVDEGRSGRHTRSFLAVPSAVFIFPPRTTGAESRPSENGDAVADNGSC